MNFWIFEFFIFEFLNFWIFEFFNFWIFEFLNFCIFEFLNFWIFNFWIFEFLSFWIFEFLNFLSGSWRCQSLQNGAGDVLNACVDSHLVVQFRIERNYFFQLSLEAGPVSAPEVTAIRWGVKGWATRSVNENWEEVRAKCGERSKIHREWEVLGYHDV